MDNSGAVIPVIVGILILGAVGYSQEADASHKYAELLGYWAEKYPNVSGHLCSDNEALPLHVSSSKGYIFLDYNPITHDPCTMIFKDGFE